MRSRYSFIQILPWLAAAAIVLSVSPAQAIPAFARKYNTSCQTCHTVYPKLNAFGEAFRRNGYRFPGKDSDFIKQDTVPLGQDAYKELFPKAVWPAQIMAAVPLSIGVNGSLNVNLPGSDARSQNGNVFAWQGLFTELHLWAGGAFSDTLTYFSEVTLNDSGLDVEHAYLLWNDVIGAPHLVNIWVGRLMNPQLTSWGLH